MNCTALLWMLICLGYADDPVRTEPLIELVPAPVVTPKPLPKVTEPATKPEPLPVVKVLDFDAKWCGYCGVFDRTQKPILQARGITVGRTPDCDLQSVDTDQFPESASQWKVGKLPYFIVTVNGHAVERHEGYLTADELLKLRAKHLPVGAYRAGTIPAKDYVSLLLNTLGKGEVQINEHVTVNLAGSLSVSINRSGDKVELSFSPPPQVRLKYGLRYDAKLNGVSVTSSVVTLKLGGLPDISLGVE